MDIAQFPQQLAEVSFPGATASSRTLFQGHDGIMDAYGTTVPVDGTPGYAKGALFRQIGATPALLINTGDVHASAFKAVTHA